MATTKLRLWPFILFFGLSSFFSLPRVAMATAHEGDTCEIDLPTSLDLNSDSCDTNTTFLECNPVEKVCRCPGNASTSYFDKFDGTCHKFVNESCEPEKGKMPCPTNGDCPLMGDPKYCLCKPGTVETSSRKCAKKHGVTCTSHSQCDSDAGLICTGENDLRRTCDCNATTSIYNPDIKACVLKLGEVCTNPDQACPVGAKCQEEADGGDDGGKVLKCLCKSGLVQNQYGQCKVLFGQSCSLAAGDEKACDESKFLICNDQNLCQCSPDLVPTLDGECRSKFGVPCDPPDWPQSEKPLCNENEFLTCAPHHQCVCREGLTDISGGDGKCRADFGASCAAQEPCDETKFLTCSPSKICQCPPNLVDLGEGDCQVPLGGHCNETMGLKCLEGQFTDCDSDEKCRCRNGLVENDKGECKVGFGGICFEPEPGCDTSKFLECRKGLSDSQCQCRQGMEMVAIGQNDGGAECQSGFGSSCANGESCHQGQNLECMSHSNHDKICWCKPGFTNRTPDGQCVEDDYYHYYFEDGQILDLSTIFFLAFLLLGLVLLAFVVRGCVMAVSRDRLRAFDRSGLGRRQSFGERNTSTGMPEKVA